MKPFPAGLDTLLATGVFVFADLYDFTLTDGTHLRYTTADVDISYSGNTFTSKGPFFDQISSQARGHWRRGLDVDTWQIAIMPAPKDPITGAAWPAKIRGLPWLGAVRAGALRGAVVDIHRGYRAAWPTPWFSPVAMTYVLVDYFAGRVSDIDLDRTRALITIESFIAMLTRVMPYNISAAGCRHTLFDAGCTLTKATFGSSAVVTTVYSNALFDSNTSVAYDVDTLGTIRWDSGNNVGYTAPVRQGPGPTSGRFQLLSPMPYAIQTGDGFTSFPGCDKQFSTCQNKFANQVNFGGQRFIPIPETAV